MKTIGTTHEGHYLIEASRTEHDILARLQMVLQMEPYYWSEINQLTDLDFDLANPLIAIKAWSYLKEKGNELRTIAGELDKALRLGQSSDEPGV